MKKITEHIREIYFFSDLDEATLEQVAEAAHYRSVNTGEVLFREGDEAKDFYLVIKGTVEVWKDYDTDEPDLLALHTKGHLFGEMAIVDELPRSSTVIAREKTDLLSISREDFHKLVRTDSSLALSLMKSVSSMVRKSNESFVEGLREKNRNLEQANHELREAQAELLRAERLSALGKFSSLILHDIRNPLSIIRAYAEMIGMNTKQAERLKKYSDKIVSEADRINRLANELLDYSRGEIRLNISIVTLKDLVAELVEDLRERFDSLNINILTDVQYSGPVLLDRERLYRVMLNLADNARKAMPDGGLFKVNIGNRSKTFFIEVTDTGIGMSDEVKKHLYEPFCSFSKGGGTGLGMCIVKSIVEAHEGSLSFQSKEGEGTRFTMSFPAMS